VYTCSTTNIWVQSQSHSFHNWMHTTVTDKWSISTSLMKLPLTSQHFPGTHFRHSVHCVELLQTPLPQTPHNYLVPVTITQIFSSSIIISVLLVLPFMPLFVNHPSGPVYHHCLQSAYSNSHGNHYSLNCLYTMTNNKGLSVDPCHKPTLTWKYTHYEYKYSENAYSYN